jgi:DHA1 family bicyclomycin/chloramphenicol resistance-like MFS transporter
MPASNSVAIIILLTFLTAIAPVGVQMYLPSLPAIAADFGSSVAEIQLTVSGFMGGFAIAHLFYGPVSDRLGRRVTLIVGTILFLAASVLALVAPNAGILIFARVLQGLGAGAGSVVGRATVRDIWGAEGSARVLAYMTMIMSVMPAISSSVGGYVDAAWGWRANFVFMTGFGAILVAGIYFLLAETNEFRSSAAVRLDAVVWNYVTLIRKPFYLGCVLTTTTSIGCAFLVMGEAPFMLSEVIGLSPTGVGYAIGIITLGVFFGALATARLIGRLGTNRMLIMGTGIMAACAVASFAFAATGNFNYWTFVLPYFGMTLGSGIVMPTAMAAAIAPHPTMAGAAAALLGFFTIGGNMGSIILVAAIRDGTPIPMTAASAVLGVAALIAGVTVFGRRRMTNS